MIDIRKLKELVRIMVNNELTELDLRDSEEQVTLRRPGVTEPPEMLPGSTAAQSSPAMIRAVPQTAPEDGRRDDEDMEGLEPIESPMVGTFYAAGDPDSPPFVKVGDRVEPETVVCMIEAMKIFNEIKAERTGTIEKVLANNAESVEFGQPLFALRED